MTPIYGNFKGDPNKSKICPHCKKPFSRLYVHLQSCSVKFGGSKWTNPSSRPRFECNPGCGKILFVRQAYNKHVKVCSKIQTLNNPI